MWKKFVCIHCHFYQPPREDPWLEEIAFQRSAWPYHDWNERITAECYLPNAYARRIDGQGRIIEIVNNYEGISFNFGPTLLLWLEKHRPEVLKKIVEADRKSCERHGHGNAIAQVYNHIIMPLANTKDKITQVKWGIAAFKHFFGRPPEGMWLAETAVDSETLAILAQNGIKFTILAPRQAEKVRPLYQEKWQLVNEATLDVTRPYRCYPDGKHFIDIFFYHGGLSQSIAFGGLVQNGEQLAHQLEQCLYGDRPQVISVATDGETFGHHWKFAEMALAYVIYYFTHHSHVEMTNFASFLNRFPPTDEVKIKENTSWSCVHGVERWKEDCGCCTGSHPGWQQKWRKPLREALNWLRDEMARLFESEGQSYFHDPWAARDDYIEIVLNPSPEVKERFFQKHACCSLDKKKRIKALQLLEMQYYGQLMFTSCGWFFDDISGLEPQQNLRYASRAIQLAQAFGLNLEKEFILRLKEAKSNLSEYGDGARIYQERIRPSLYSLEHLAVHFSFSYLFDEPPSQTRFYTTKVEVKKRENEEAGGNYLLLNHLYITHLRTEEEKELIAVVLYLGGLDLTGAVFSPHASQTVEEIKTLFKGLSFFELKDKLKAIPCYFSINDVFFDNRRQLAIFLVEDKLKMFHNTYLEFYQENKSLMFALKELHIPLPEVFVVIARTVLERFILKEFKKELEGQPNRLKMFMAEAKALGIEIDTKPFTRLLSQFAQDELAQFFKSWNIKHIQRLNQALHICKNFCANFNLWPIQNLFWDMLPLIKKHFSTLPPEIFSLARELNFCLED